MRYRNKDRRGLRIDESGRGFVFYQLPDSNYVFESAIQIDYSKLDMEALKPFLNAKPLFNDLQWDEQSKRLVYRYEAFFPRPERIEAVENGAWLTLDTEGRVLPISDVAFSLYFEPVQSYTNETRAAPVADAIDLLEGADAIAQFIYGDGKQRRKVYHLIETGVIPTFRLGAILCARKSTLVAWIEKQERGEHS